ncbi:threonine aldolase family protein [Maledivibacter halophilus]|uniref:L-threonine aldolase n=1 Tax=Maledivibacter halophilus TaxID=36842 RepID=A0A1T5J2Z1_9FIRM|nr:threonine aldolase family protein [Maledivibacter halophilus]SKC45588.1 L-threonine aldolase [Maledivibacter halophilus]
MIDLRSDTLSLPEEEMLKTILHAKLGDDGRTNENGRGEDLTVNELEDFAAKLTGKDGSILFSSGTLANTTAILTYCNPNDKVLVDEIQHIYKSEKVVFEKSLGQLIPVTYKLNKRKTPDINDIRNLLNENNIKLLCIENPHNFAGGTCINLEELKEIYKLAKEFNVHVHMDGARLFNAVVSLGVKAEDICKYVDSVMFCLSKGLGAPIGSLLCGNKDFIKKARIKRKLLGGNMRQAGIIAAPGLYALQNNIDTLKQDHENARYVVDNLKDLKKTKVQKDVQTNIVMLDIRETGLTAEKYCAIAKEKGLLIRSVLGGNKVRLVFYRGISRNDTIIAAKIIKDIDSLI